jgi:signal peptidase II
MSNLLWPVISIIVFVLDLLSKNWAKLSLSSEERKPFIDGFLDFILVTNTGGAFGIGKELGPYMNYLVLFMFCALILYTLKKIAAMSNLEKTGFAILLGGAAGNLYDRFAFGRVTDFLEFTFIRFPVFNMADVFIDIGIGLIVIHWLIKAKNQS